VLGTGVALSVLLGALLWMLAQLGALYQEVGRLARTDSLTGVADWDRREDVAQLTARALYAAKAGGRDQCRADPAPAPKVVA
jgi:hypothetical protein